MPKRTYRRVEMTSPDAENRFKVFYDGFVRWTNDKPGDGRGSVTGPSKEQKMHQLFSKPSTRRCLKVLWEAILSGERFKEAVQEMYSVMGPKNGINAIRHVREYEKRLLDEKDGMGDEEKGFRQKVIDGLDEANKVLRNKVGPQEKYDKMMKMGWLTTDQMEKICPSCAGKMRRMGIRFVNSRIVTDHIRNQGGKTMSARMMVARELLSIAGELAAAERMADKWESLPRGWTEESLKKYWSSLTGTTKHKVSKCMREMEGKVSDPGAFCGGLSSRLGLR